MRDQNFTFSFQLKKTRQKRKVEHPFIYELRSKEKGLKRLPKNLQTQTTGITTLND